MTEINHKNDRGNSGDFLIYFSAIFLFLLVAGCLSGCGGGSGGSAQNKSATQNNTQSPTVKVLPDQTIVSNGTTYSFDVYQASNADKAVIFLHGGGGTKYGFACQLGLNQSNGCSTNDPFDGTDYSSINGQVLINNKAIAVFPQGQSISSAPHAYTWSNYVMTSGQDDMQFLNDLVNYLASTYNIAKNKFYLVGHSNGGMMANRVWCEDPGLFSAYVAISGPPSEHFLNPNTQCSPAEVQPYLGIVGSDDTVLQVIGYDLQSLQPDPTINNWENPTWTVNPLLTDPAFLDSVVIGERSFLPDRVQMSCNETVASGDASATTSGNVTEWSFCNNSIQLLRVNGAGHGIVAERLGEPPLDQIAGQNFVLKTAFNFIASH